MSCVLGWLDSGLDGDGEEASGVSLSGSFIGDDVSKGFLGLSSGVVIFSTACSNPIVESSSLFAFCFWASSSVSVVTASSVGLFVCSDGS